MKAKICFIVSIGLFISLTSALAQQRSAKRGVCWDESTQPLTDAPVSKMAPGVSWYYNWGQTPQAAGTTLIDAADGMAYVPMCWNGNFNETALRNYLTSRTSRLAPQSSLLLGFNEPNLTWNVGGSQMTPQQAADAWPAVKKVAHDFGLQLVAPALNFSGDLVGGRVWSPFEWYDEFFRLCPDSGIDYLAFHSYMNWYSAVNWVASEYFYTDKDNGNLMSATNRAKYPNLVKFMDDYLTAHGHYPKMFLTEFCSGEGDKDGYVSSVSSQIDQMTQKVQKLEQSDMVAGYAWFMGNTSQAPSQYPYNSVFRQNTPGSELSDLGLVYVYMSSFDKEKYYVPGEQILAKDYIDASLDNQQVKVRPNTETDSDIPLQVELQSGTLVHYQVSVPKDGDYTLTLHMKSVAAGAFRVYLDQTGAANAVLKTTLNSTGGRWADQTVTVPLKAGEHRILLWNGGAQSMFMNSLHFDAGTTGIGSLTPALSQGEGAWYTLDGRKVVNGTLPKGIYIYNGKKIIIK